VLDLIEAYLKHSDEIQQGDEVFGYEIILSSHGNGVIVVEYGLTRQGQEIEYEIFYDEYREIELTELLGFLWGKMNEKSN